MKLLLASTLLLPLITAGPLPPNAMRAQAETAESVRFVPSLTSTLDPAADTAWVGTFKLAWEAFLSNTPEVRLPALAGPLAAVQADAFDSASLAPERYVAVGGLDTEAVLREARTALRERFGLAETPELEAAAFPGLIAFAYLSASVSFPYAFEDLSGQAFPFQVGGDAPEETEPLDAQSFGIEDYDPNSSHHRLWGEQVRVLRHEGPADFVVELRGGSGDRIYLGRSPGQATLAAHWTHVRTLRDRSRAEDIPGSRLQAGDSLRVPKLDLDARQLFAGLEVPLIDRTIRADALQTLELRLDERGAEMTSQLLMSLAYQPRAPRQMHLDGPFFLALAEEGAALPYCAVWIATPKALRPRMP